MQGNLRQGVWHELERMARDRRARGETSPLEVVLTSSGPVVNREAMTYLAHRAGLADAFEFHYRHMGDAAYFRPLIARADVVVAGQRGSGVVTRRNPANAAQNRTLNAARTDPGLAEVARFPAGRGKHFYIFERREEAKGQTAPRKTSGD